MKWLTKENGTFKEIGTEALTVIPVKNTMTVLIKYEHQYHLQYGWLLK